MAPPALGPHGEDARDGSSQLTACTGCRLPESFVPWAVNGTPKSFGRQELFQPEGTAAAPEMLMGLVLSLLVRVRS